MQAAVRGESQSSIKVCVRVRPFSRREVGSEPKCCVRAPTRSQLAIYSPGGTERTFVFDRVFWSFDPSRHGSQQALVDELGKEIRTSALEGYNHCLFVYGQTGSGKTHTIFGSPGPPEARGVLPMVVDELFDAVEVERRLSDASHFTMHVSYLEIYDETVRDLLAPPQDASKPILRQNPKVGVYVQDLKDVPVFAKDEVLKLLEFGSKARSVAATCMNDHSSRSHCIFTLEVVRKRRLPGGNTSLLRAKLNFVDLAGSEREPKTVSTRLRESGINRSLHHLVQVMHKLVELGRRPLARGSNGHIPFRNSKLTYLLQDCLSGNSKTVMIATLSPTETDHDESLSTLRFAESVKGLRTCARRNEEVQENLVACLRTEIEQLKAQIHQGQGGEHELAGLEALVQKYSGDLVTQFQHAKSLEEQRQQALVDIGLNAVEADGRGASSTPQLVNASADPALAQCLVYSLPRSTRVKVGSAKECQIVLTGLGMKEQMAEIENKDDANLIIRPLVGRVLVNGHRLRQEVALSHGDRLILGHAFCFRVNVPQLQKVCPAHGEVQTLEHALREVVPVDSEAYARCCSFVNSLEGRIGAQAFLQKFRRLLNLCDEANEITREVRPRERCDFCIEVVTDLLRDQEQSPDCVVRLKKFETGKARLRSIIHRKVMKRHEGDNGPEPFATVALFEPEAFKECVAHLREVYSAFRHGGTTADAPLWCHVNPWEVAAAVADRERAVRDAQQLEQTLKAKTALAKRDERIEELERELKQWRHSGTMCQIRASASPAASPKASPRRVPGVELDDTFARQLFTSLKDMKRDLQSQSETIQTIGRELDQTFIPGVTWGPGLCTTPSPVVFRSPRV